jgi:hypothetical protein
MRKSPLGSALGLSIIAGSFTVSAPAQAFTLHNYSTGFCLAVAPVVVWSEFFDQNGNPDWQGHPDQYWCVYP